MMHWTLEHFLKSVHLGMGRLVPNSVFRAAALIQLGGCSSMRWKFCELKGPKTKVKTHKVVRRRVCFWPGPIPDIGDIERFVRH